MEPRKFSAEGLESIPRREAKVLQGFGLVDCDELVIRAFLNLTGNLAGRDQTKNLLSRFVSEARNQGDLKYSNPRILQAALSMKSGG